MREDFLSNTYLFSEHRLFAYMEQNLNINILIGVSIMLFFLVFTKGSSHQCEAKVS